VNRSTLEANTRAAWRDLVPQTVARFDALFATPELAALEFGSMTCLADWLAQHGFDVERGAGNVPTAFVARRANGVGPRVGLLAEYDALPGLDNAAVAERTSTSRHPGHGCGHNHIGPANTAAAIAAARGLEATGIPGEIVVVGCPAEEIVWGKLALQAAGVFDGLGAILTSHGDYQNGALSRPCFSIANGEFRFTGEAAHSGKITARNALGAAEAAVAGFREAVEEASDGARFKHVYRFAGFAPGVTPDEVRLWCLVRHADFDTMRAAYAHMEDVFRRTAARFHVGLRADLIAACRGYLPNDTLGRVLAECLGAVGAPRWRPEDLRFMQDLSSACAPGETFELDRSLGYFDTGIDYYGQDDGDVSWQIPLGRVNWAYPATIPIHHWAWTALSGHPASRPGSLMASEALAMGAARLVAAPERLDAAKHELERRTENIDLPPPEIGLFEVLTQQPQAFWDASW